VGKKSLAITESVNRWRTDNTKSILQ